ncbi:MAG: hypothetical protein ACYDEN_05730 [Acidimicrobiales bacterium]
MSRSIDLFIATDTPLDELAAVIAARTGLEVQTRAGDGATLIAGRDAAAVLAVHAHADAGDLRLSRYRYALTATTEAAHHVGDTPQATMLRGVASALAGVLPVLLVVDLQFRGQRVATG